jgi:hypothetical protein
MKVKCNARIFVYRVGERLEQLEFHPGCDGFSIELLNETFAVAEGRGRFGAEAQLVEVRDEVHYIERDKPKAKEG